MKRRGTSSGRRTVLYASVCVGVCVTLWLILLIVVVAQSSTAPGHASLLGALPFGHYGSAELSAARVGGGHDPGSHVRPHTHMNAQAQDAAGPAAQPTSQASAPGMRGTAAKAAAAAPSTPPSVAHPLLSSGPPPVTQTPRCFTWGTWTEACVYDNVCYDPKSRVVLMYDAKVASLPSVSDAPRRRRRRTPGVFDREDYAAKLGNVFESHNDLLTGQVLPLEVMPPADFPKWLPMNSNLRARFMGHEEAARLWTATRAEVQQLGQHPEPSVLDDVAWVAANKEHLSNIWYYSSRITTWFELTVMNASRALPFPLEHPTTVYLATPAKLVSSDWHRSFLALTLDITVADLDAYGNAGDALETLVVGGRRLPRVIYREHGAHHHVHDQSAPDDPRTDFSERTRCFRTLIATGASGFLFGSTLTASEFRARALAVVGRGDQPKYVGPGVYPHLMRYNPPRKVLLIDRQRNKPRAIVNIDAVKKLLKAYDVPFTHSVDFRGSFDEQVRLYNDHGVLLGVHGAGFINCMFMRQGSAVIEVFPYHLKHTLYARQAFMAGLTHFPVYSTDPSSIFKPGNWLRDYMGAKCEQMPSLMTQWRDNACRGPLIGSTITVPMRALEEALVEALDMIGYRTEYRGIFNTEPLFTVTDKSKFAEMMKHAEVEAEERKAAKKKPAPNVAPPPKPDSDGAEAAQAGQGDVDEAALVPNEEQPLEVARPGVADRAPPRLQARVDGDADDGADGKSSGRDGADAAVLQEEDVVPEDAA